MGDSANLKGWTIRSQKDDFVAELRGSVYKPDSGHWVDFVAAIREGLEANGWDVEAEMLYETSVRS